MDVKQFLHTSKRIEDIKQVFYQNATEFENFTLMQNSMFNTQTFMSKLEARGLLTSTNIESTSAIMTNSSPQTKPGPRQKTRDFVREKLSKNYKMLKENIVRKRVTMPKKTTDESSQEQSGFFGGGVMGKTLEKDLNATLTEKSPLSDKRDKDFGKELFKTSIYGVIRELNQDEGEDTSPTPSEKSASPPN
jgi:hypothetical protein